jgi:hypothetical protein
MDLSEEKDCFIESGTPNLFFFCYFWIFFFLVTKLLPLLMYNKIKAGRLGQRVTLYV